MDPEALAEALKKQAAVAETQGGSSASTDSTRGSPARIPRVWQRFAARQQHLSVGRAAAKKCWASVSVFSELRTRILRLCAPLDRASCALSNGIWVVGGLVKSCRAPDWVSTSSIVRSRHPLLEVGTS